MIFYSNNGLEAKYNPYWEKFLLTPRQPLDSYDLEQVAMGIDVEMEHSNNPEIALFITLHHLDEFPDYYFRLYDMEEIADKYWGN